MSTKTLKDNFDAKALKTAKGGFNFIAAQRFEHHVDGQILEVEPQVGPSLRDTFNRADVSGLVDKDVTQELAQQTKPDMDFGPGQN